MKATLETTTDRTLPHSIEAERAVLGACLVNADAFGEALEVVQPAQFFRVAHRTIFEHMRSLADASTQIDVLTVKNALAKSGALDEIGGPAYVAGLMDGVPRSANVAGYARIVRDKALLRDTVHAANKMLAEAYDEADDAAAIVARAEQLLVESTSNASTAGFKRLSEILPTILEQLDGWCASRDGITGIPTGLADLDAMTMGLQRGNIIIVAARPSMGKTSLAENIGRFAARHGHVVGMVSIEMSEEEVALRSVSSEAAVDSHRMRRGRIFEREYGRISHAMGELSEIPFFVLDTPSVTAFDIRTKAKRLQAEQGRLDLLIVDYIQLMKAPGKYDGDKRQLEVANISRQLKQVARELNVPIIVLSQLSRDLEKRVDKRPILSDLRDSGALEQDADVVIFIYRPVRYAPEPVGEFQHLSQESYETLAELIVAKQRNGPVGTIETNWSNERTLFTDRVPAVDSEDRRLPIGDR